MQTSDEETDPDETGCFLTAGRCQGEPSDDLALSITVMFVDSQPTGTPPARGWIESLPISYPGAEADAPVPPPRLSL